MSSQQAASALRWWSDAGVDVIVGETARDWLKPAAPKAAAAAKVGEEPAPFLDKLPGELGEFQAWLTTSLDLPGAAPSATRLGPSGPAGAAVMVLTDLPSAADFAAGALASSDGLFDKMLAAIGLDRSRIYMASLSPLRPASGSLDAAAARRCAEIARHHVALVAPKTLLLLGDGCARALLGGAVAQTRGKWHGIETDRGPFRALTTMKPENLNLQPTLKKLAWADLQMLKEGFER